MRRRTLRSKKRKTKTSKYRSKFEETIAENLSRRKVSFDYESQQIPYTLQKNYKPDFILPNGILVEAKGWFRSQDQRKHRIIKEQNPHLDIRFVFMKLTSRVQGSTMTCQEWCEKYGFKYSESTIPKDWIKERH